MRQFKIYQILLITFCGMFGSILIGFIFFNTTVFVPIKTNFQFVIIGFIGSLFFSQFEYKNLREQLFALVIVLFLHIIIFSGRSISISYILRDIFYIGSVFLSVNFYHQFIKRNKIRFYLRSFALALFLGLIYTVFIIILFLINAHSGFPPVNFIYVIAGDGVLIGLGIGLGLDFYLQNEKYFLNLLKIKTA